MNEMKIFLYIIYKSTWIKDLNVRFETIKLEENISRTLYDINCNTIFLDHSPKAK